MKKFVLALKMFFFYLLSFTWGLPLTLIGAIVSGILLLLGYKPKLYCGQIYFETKTHWDGISLGIFFISAKDCDLEDKQRLVGHGVLNTFAGAFTLFVITIPLLLRALLSQLSDYNQKRKVAGTMFLCTEGVAMVSCTIGYFFSELLMHIFCCVIVYIIPLSIWFLAQELPRHLLEKESYKMHPTLADKTAIKLGKKFTLKFNN